jgi:hypothetical protein
VAPSRELVTSRLRAAASLVLAACVVLPISTCTRYVDAQGEAVAVEAGAPVPEGAREIVDHQVPIEQLVSNPLGGILILVAFLWPLAFLAYGRWGARARIKAALWWLEPLLLTGSAHYVYTLAFLGEPAVGAWLAAASLAVLAVLWLSALVERLGRARGSRGGAA